MSEDSNVSGATYDLIILGGGAAAFAAANRANLLKKQTLMINDQNIIPLGGTCVNVGCIPSKIMLYQGATGYYPPRSAFRGVTLQGETDFVAAVKETREMAAGFQEQNYGKVIAQQEHVDFEEGHARFVDSHTVQVGEKQYAGKNIIIATGAETFIPPIPGIDSVEYLTNRNVFELTEQPESVIILGGGAIAMEFSQIFHHFGVETTVVQRSARVLTKIDEDIAKTLQEELTKEGITILTDSTIKEVKKTGDGVELHITTAGDEQMLVAEKILVALGIKAHTDTIAIENSGVELDKRGFVNVNEYLQTNVPHIYAVGDVNGIKTLETIAAKQGSIAVLNMFENAKKTIDYGVVPSVVFTHPEVAVVGITEAEYMKKYGTCKCSTIDFAHVEKVAAIKETAGIARMVVDHKTNVVLGVHLVGPMAGDIITTATYAIKNKMTLDDIKDTVHVFPTVSEVIKKVAQSFDQDLDSMACCVE